jgi:hypothetical protein
LTGGGGETDTPDVGVSWYGSRRDGTIGDPSSSLSM